MNENKLGFHILTGHCNRYNRNKSCLPYSYDMAQLNRRIGDTLFLVDMDDDIGVYEFVPVIDTFSLFEMNKIIKKIHYLRRYSKQRGCIMNVVSFVIDDLNKIDLTILLYHLTKYAVENNGKISMIHEKKNSAFFEVKFEEDDSIIPSD